MLFGRTVNLLSGLTDLLWVSSFLAVVLDKVHKTMHDSFHCYQSLLKLLPGGRRGIYGKRHEIQSDMLLNIIIIYTFF